VEIETLVGLKAAFEDWRRKKRHVREAVPGELLERARRAIGVHGLGAVVRATKVEGTRLRKGSARGKSTSAAGRVPAFCPTACVDDAAFGYVSAFKDHVNIGFFTGALLKDPAGLLEGTGKRERHVKLRPNREVDGSALEQLIDAAYVDIRARLGK